MKTEINWGALVDELTEDWDNEERAAALRAFAGCPEDCSCSVPLANGIRVTIQRATRGDREIVGARVVLKETRKVVRK